MKLSKRKYIREWKTVVMLDAPGITGMSTNSLEKFVAYVAAGGQTLHPMRVRSHGKERKYDARIQAENSRGGGLSWPI